MRAFALLPILLLVACGTPDPSGLDEPFQVIGGQFIEGSLPGPAAGSEERAGPEIHAFGWSNPIVLAGQREKSIEGRVSAEATAVAIRFEEFGSGYWLVPTGPEEPQYPGQRTFSLRASFPEGLPPGKHRIAAAAILPNGDAGPRASRELCVAGSIPDNFHACDAETAPPAMVVSLHWSVDADLDLQLITSDGRVVSPEKPLLDAIDAGAPPGPMAARIDRDSLAACIPDGLRRESFILQERLPKGSSLAVHANLKDACGHSSVAFRLEVHERRGSEGDFQFVQTFSRSGLLSAHDAGQATGLFIGRIRF